ncbi:MAG: ATP-binding protein [Vulcanimicrobiota bacterium]
MSKRFWIGGLLLLQLGWTAVWLNGQHSQRVSQTRQLASLIAHEILVDGDGSVLWDRLATVPEVRGGELLGPDRQTRAHFGENLAPACECSLVESGQLVGYLRLSFAPPPLLGVLVSWSALLAGLSIWLLTARRQEKSAPVQGHLLLELDENHRVQRIHGHQQEHPLLGLGQSLGTELPGKLVRHLGSGEGQPGLVVVRDTRAWENLRSRLRELREHYRNLCDLAQDYILVTQPEGTLIFANMAALGLFPQAEAGADIWDYFDPACRSLAQQSFRDCLVERRAVAFQAQLSGPHGETVPVEGSFCPGLVESGVAVTVLGIFRDLTRQRRAEEKLRQAQKMEAVGRLAGGVAHDFNNLLTVVSNVVSLMRLEQSASTANLEYLQMLEETVDRAAELTRQLLLFTRRSPVAPVPQDVDQVLTDLFRLARRLLGEDIALHTDLQAAAWVSADRSELEQIAMNLLVNARDAMPGGGRLDVTSRNSIWNQQACVELQFSDCGSGIAPEIVGRIFEPYFTTKEVGKGTGLGLSTTYAVVTRLGGTIEVESQLGQGTRFIVQLPTVARPAPEARVQVIESSQASHGNILLVEDEVSLCFSTTKALRKFGYEVTPAISPVDALTWLKAAPSCPDLLVTDVIMPGMSGADLARQARELFPQLKVLFVSGYPGDNLNGVDQASLEFLAKPYRTTDLNRRIRQLLERSGAPR